MASAAALDAIATRLVREAGALDALAGRLDSIRSVVRVAWVGPASDRFDDEASSHRRSVETSAGDLRWYASVLRQRAADIRAAEASAAAAAAAEAAAAASFAAEEPAEGAPPPPGTYW